MKTSEIERALQGNLDWQSFCAMYGKERARLLSRKDGAVTSGDLGLLFDSGQVIVTGEQIKRLCNAVFESEIDLSDALFLSNVIALSGFDFDNDFTEDAVLLISSPNSSGMNNIEDAMQIL